ncbi:chalcone isomerase [Gaertneriomyces semiglobifer]|nr:chalcone isomerase [Gaertneriomyces semiglobifer]
MRLQVTFVKLNVYTVSIYGPQSLFSYIRSSPLWKSFTSAEFAKKPEQDMMTNPYISDLVRNASTLVVHIRPTRVTDGAHIRNGILRFLTKKLAVEDAKGTVTDTQKHEIDSAFDELRAVLPSSRKIGKDDVLSFTLVPDGLKVEGVGVSGHVKNRWVAERFFESYLEGAISPSLKANVAATLETALRK